MNQKLGDEFLSTCKQNYFDRITPANRTNRSKEGYKKIVAISSDYFKRGEYLVFAGFFQEGQYFIALWAAHMLVEYGSPDQELMIEAINVIKRYTENPLAPGVADEEKQWITVFFCTFT
jgi:hypothetical protein